jgi:putative ABC transport system permease protein
VRHLLRLISVRYLRAAPGRTGLTLFGIMLGVSVVFAIDVVNSSVMGSFRGTIDGIAGKTALTVGAGVGVDEELLEQVRAVPGVSTAVPVIEESARDRKSRTQLVVLGVDTLGDSNVRDYEVTSDDVKIEDDIAFLNDPHAVVVTQRFAQRTGVKIGDTLSLETIAGVNDFTIRGTLAPRGPANVFGGDLLLMDVYAAQIAFGRGKRFDHIDVVPAAGVDVAALGVAIEKALGGKALVARPERRSQEAERLMEGFKLGLSLAGLVAMFVGGFIVYNALAIAVAQRRREIGILRALGATRGQVLTLFVGEGLALGAVGAVLGVGFGLVMARSVLRVMGSTISTMYVQVQPEALVVAPMDVIVAVSLGVGAAFVAAFFPARHAASVEPASVMRKKTDAGDVTFSSTSASLKAVGVSLLAAAALAAYAHHTEDYMIGYAVSGILAFTAAFLSPAVARGVGLAARGIAKRIGPAALFGTVSFTRNAGRNSVAIAALGMGLANVVNADAFVNSMKHNTTRWFERSARADVFVFVAGENVKAKVDHPLPESVGQELGKLPGVEFVDAYRTSRQSLNGQPFQLVSYDLVRYRKYNDVPVVSGNLDEAVAAISAGTGLAASEVFAKSFGVKLGDKVTLQTPDGPRSFEIVLVYVDYGADRGILTTTRAIYTSVWKDTLVDQFALYVKKGASVEDVRQHILADLGQRYSLLALGNGEYKAEFMKFIDGSFVLTRATEIVAIIVAVLGIINTLLVTVLDRRTEIGVLKAIGADPKQVRAMLLTEGALIGLSATLIGIGFGMLFSAYIVQELLRFQIGWIMDWQLSGWVLLETFIVAQLVTLLAVWWPMRSAGRVDAVEALQYE